MLRAMGVAEARPLPDAGEVAGGAITCIAAGCRFRPRPDAAEALLLRSPPAPRGRRSAPAEPATAPGGCSGVALALALEPIRPRCAEGLTMDRFAMWRDGAQAAWLGPAGARVATDRALRGNRPWVPPVPLPGRAEALPMAPAE
jgi:competence protein ComEC